MIIGICDDEQKSIELLVEYCERVKAELHMGFSYITFSSGEEVLKYDGGIDILLLDIEMDGANGIETMRKLENYDNIKNILFVSGYSEKVFEAFGVKTRGFVCKPVDYDRFAGEIRKIVESEKHSEIIELPEKSQTQYIKIDDIIYLSGEGKYVRIVTANREYLICGSLKEWKLKLEKYDIIQVHKSYLVNLDYVKNLKDLVDLIDVEKQLPVGRKYKDVCRQMYREYTFRKFREKVNGR